MSKRLIRVIRTKIAWLLAIAMIVGGVAQDGMTLTAKAEGSIAIQEAYGYEEGACVEFSSTVTGAYGYKVYVKEASAADSAYVQLDNELIRRYSGYARADAVGLKAGTYVLRIDAVAEDGTVLETKVSDALTVTNYDRSGFAFSSESTYKTGSGAYNDDGTLKSDAQVIYVTKDTAKTVTAVVTNTGKGTKETVTGLQAIFDARQSATDSTPLDVRIIGCVKDTDMDSLSSDEEGLQIKGKAAYSEVNVTIEGIGEDAVIWGFGFLMRNCGNLEVRNLGLLYFMDDAISVNTDNCNIWVHNLDIFYGKPGSAKDQVKGDGSVDLKDNSTYITIAYNHFWDSGKCSLCGMKSENEFFVTYHHNWFDHSDSRHPRIRKGTIHIYNNFYDGNSKYGVGVTWGSSAFVENNYFRNVKNPMLSSQMGTDALGEGTFSGEDGGVIKAYNNKIVGAKSLIYANSDEGTVGANKTSFDAYLAAERNEKVPAEYISLKGESKYNNFDTEHDLGVDESAIDSTEDVAKVVEEKAGRIKGGDFTWEFDDATEDTNYDIITNLQTAVKNYKSKMLSVGGYPMGGSIGGGNSSDDDESQSGGNPSDNDESQSGGTQKPVITGTMTHNFDTQGLTSTDEWLTISGSTTTKFDAVTYNGTEMKTALKMNSGGKVVFEAPVDGKLILVVSSTNNSMKVNGKKYTANPNIIEIDDLKAGTVEIIQGNGEAGLFYVEYIPNVTVTPSDAAESSDVVTSSEAISSSEASTPSESSSETAGSSEASTPSESSSEATGSSEASTPSESESSSESNQRDGLEVELRYPNETYVYTGSAVKPEIIVYHNGFVLTEGVDYTVKYSNNVKAALKTDKKAPKITVSGKGFLSGKQETTFTIEKKKLSELELNEVTVAKGSKAVPLLAYNGMKLGTKDYVVKNASAVYNSDGKMTVEGQGNYEGTVEIDVKVVDNKSELKKFKVEVSKDNLVYNGEAQYPAGIKVIDSKDAAKILKESKDGEPGEYIIVYGNNVNAGTAKFTIIGLGEYSGSVITKTYKINPVKATESDMKITGIDNNGYTYVSTGVTFSNYEEGNGKPVVSYKEHALEEGRDYKITYSSNKKFGTGKYTVSFIGNYKGSKAIKKEFKIIKAPMNDNTVEIVVPDKVYGGKPNVYKSTPIVTMDGVLIKSSEYTVEYYFNGKPVDKKTNAITVTNEAAEVEVRVKAKPNSNFDSGSGYVTGKYYVRKADANVYDLSKAKVSFKDKDGKVVKKFEYTGKELEPQVEISLKINGKPEIIKADEGLFDVSYTNNVNKGKATVVITGTGETVNGKALVGSKNANFSIVAMNLKAMTDLMKDMFGIMF